MPLNRLYESFVNVILYVCRSIAFALLAFMSNQYSDTDKHVQAIIFFPFSHNHGTYCLFVVRFNEVNCILIVRVWLMTIYWIAFVLDVLYNKFYSPLLTLHGNEFKRKYTAFSCCLQFKSVLNITEAFSWQTKSWFAFAKMNKTKVNSFYNFFFSQHWFSSGLWHFLSCFCIE